MAFSYCSDISTIYCFNCLHGPHGCLVPSRPAEGADLSSQFEELDSKLLALAKKRSLEIEEELKEEKLAERGTIKILILGGPSSGKSTIFKQMQIIHGEGFKRPDELEYYKGLINSNIRDIYVQLVNGAKRLEIYLGSIEIILKEIDEILENLLSEGVNFLRINKRLAELLKTFWESSSIQAVFARRYDIELMDSTKYFLEEIERIGVPDYVPNLVDIVHSRRATTSINNMVFHYTGLRLNMVDVGGQRSERRKWLHLFEDAKVVLFVVDLTGFAKKSEESRTDIARFKLFEEWRENAVNVPDMKVALKIFHDVAINKILRNSVFLLFFNKVDLFEELLSTLQLSTCFSSFRGENNFEETTNYIREKFLKAAKPRKSIHPHFTTATNTENIAHVFRACMESVFKANSKATGLN